ncbi:MAG: kelch repeat-containing protein [Terracidiphilus sp.]|jgi:hypothetical protein
MNSNMTLALKASNSGHINLKASEPRRNPMPEMAARRQTRRSASWVAALLLGAISVPAFAQNWILELPDNTPPARAQAVMVNDGATGKVVLFGGAGNSGLLSDTWSWDGADWTQELPATSPSARSGFAMAYDAAHGQVVLFGGAGISGSFSDTWVWNGVNWIQETPASSPPARTCSAMKYDSARGVVVLFGGFANGSYLSDTWLWNGTNWTQVAPGTSPSPRCTSGGAYDAGDQKVVLFGGYNYKTTGYLSDTWAWDGSDWIEQDPPASPSGRDLAGMAYDSVEKKVVLFGGVGSPGYLSDTWLWDGTDWTQQNPTDLPAARSEQAMAPDAQGNVVMFGGYNSSGILADTWVWANGPAASLNTAKLNFGKQAVKTSSAAQEVQLTNSGVNTLSIHSFTFTGSDPKDFEESNNCHGSLKPGFSCTIDVTFKPTAKGTRSAKLVIKDNAQNGSQSVSLSGTGD